MFEKIISIIFGVTSLHSGLIACFLRTLRYSSIIVSSVWQYASSVDRISFTILVRCVSPGLIKLCTCNELVDEIGDVDLVIVISPSPDSCFAGGCCDCDCDCDSGLARDCCD